MKNVSERLHLLKTKKRHATIWGKTLQNFIEGPSLLANFDLFHILDNC